MMTGAQAMVQALEEEGVSVVFGYPGAAICPFYNSLAESNVKHILVRNEQNAGHMASGYARMSRKVGVCVATSGPGATNLITALATAYMDSIPLVALTGQVSSELLGRDVFQEVDITGATAPFTKHNCIVKHVEDIPRIMKEAFYLAATGRPGPVLVDVPVDIQQRLVDFVYPEMVDMRGYKPSTKGHPLQIKRVEEAISEAQRPLVCCGGGVLSANACEELRALCEKVGMPIACTMMGLGAVPSEHPLYVGMIGAYGADSANRALQECDLLLVVGARVGDRAVADPQAISPNTKILHIDIDPAEIGKNMSTNLPLVGDAKVVLGQILRCNFVPKQCWWALRRPSPTPCPKVQNGIEPNLLMQTLSKKLHADATVVADVGQNQIWVTSNLEIRSGRFLTTGGFGTMGYSLPAALGAKIAAPDKETIVICGDGGFQMMLPELATMVENNIDVKVIVLNNNCLGMVREMQQKAGKPAFGVMLSSPDIVALAAAYGVPASRITDNADIPHALDSLLSTKGPSLLECGGVLATEQSFAYFGDADGQIALAHIF